jgi:radical SAM superfamily enzyme YgiQ (UPF0313 family)
MTPRPRDGFRFVLTASRAEMSQFGPEAGRPADGFRAFRCTFPRRMMGPFVEKYFSPPAAPNGIARFAPYSLRKVEAVLGLRYGPEHIAVCHPDRIEELVGRDTEVVGISTMDPLGLAYVSTTYNSLVGLGGESVNAYEFRRLMRTIGRLRKRAGFKVVVGGEAAWQIILARRQQELGIDHLFIGRAEAELGGAMDAILAGTAARVIRFRPVDYARTQIPLIRAPAIYGDVEITRGCGRGCAFCSPNLQRKDSVPLQEILEEVRINIGGGARSVFTISDDMFLYESRPGFVPNRDSIVGLYRALADQPGVRHIHLSHGSLAAVLAEPRLLPDLAPLLVAKSARTLHGKPYATVEVGIESGSVEIMRRYMRGKALPLDVGDWPRIVSEAIGEFNAHRIYPLATVILGWPSETAGDAEDTFRLVERLRRRNARIFYTPIVFVPIERTPLGRSRRIGIKDLPSVQLRTIQTCWEANIEVWGSRVSPAGLRVVGLAAKAIAAWRSLRGAETAPISHGFADFLLRRRFPCDPGLCGGGEESGTSREGRASIRGTER